MSSLLEDVQSERPQKIESTTLPLPFAKTVGALVDEIHTDLLVTKYTNCNFVSVTQLGKLGTIVQVLQEQVQGIEGNSKIVYSSQLLFGLDSEEIQLMGRVLAEKIKHQNKSLILCVGIKGLNIDLALKLVDLIMLHM